MKKSSRRSSILPKDGAKSANSVGSFSTRFSLPSFVKRVHKLTEAQKEAIRKTGFGNLLLIPNQMLCKNLLVELMERWDCDKSAFVFPHGEISISLMDVALILGLRVIGDSVIVGDDTPFTNLERDYGGLLWNRKITVASVEERLESLGEIDDEDFIRSFLLYAFGTLLFPNSSGKIDSRYLYLLWDVDHVDRFAWGAAVLDDVFYWLTKRKKDNVQYVGGCLIFLQVWCYEHIDIARPGLNENPVKFPRVCRWGSSKSHHRQWYIEKFKTFEKFKTLCGNQIIWSLELTSEESEVGAIKELLESQSEIGGKITKQQSSPVVCDIEQLVDDMEMDSATTVSKGIYHEQNGNVKITSPHGSDLSSGSCCVESEIEPPEHPKLNSHADSTVLITVNDNCDDDLQRKNRILEEQITKLRNELDELTRENKMLNSHLSPCLEFEKHNVELKKEVESLRQENRTLSSAANTLVARLERIVLDEDTETVDNQGIENLLEQREELT